MTRRDYETLAEALRSARLHAATNTDRLTQVQAVDVAGRKIARRIKEQNASFDVIRFLTDCGIST